MLSLRNRFGIPGVISVIALVFAMMGGAYAAENSGDGASASAKKNKRAKKNRGKNKGVTVQQVRRIARQEARKFAGQGPIGPQGVPGLPGAPGSDGDDGSNGSNGSNGKNGESVTLAAATGCGVPGGTKLSVDGDSEEVCNGEDGEDGENGTFGGGTLPSGETLTGAWSLAEGEEVFAAITFAMPLPEEIGISNIKEVTPEDEENETVPAECEDGSVLNPKAEPGFFCLYVANGESVGGGISVLRMNGKTQFEALGTSTVGAVLRGIQVEGYVDGLAEVPAMGGSWAVTAP